MDDWKQQVRKDYDRGRFWVDNDLTKRLVPELGRTNAAVYIALLRRIDNKTQRCFPSHKRIMQESGVGNKKTLIKCLNTLEDRNVIKKIIRGGGRGHPNHYAMIDRRFWKLKGGSNDTDYGTGKGGGSDDKEWQFDGKYGGDSATGRKLKDKETQSFIRKQEQESEWRVKVLEWAEEKLGGRFPDRERQLKAVKKMEDSGYTENEIKKCWEIMKADHFWERKGFDLINVANEIPKRAKRIREGDDHSEYANIGRRAS